MLLAFMVSSACQAEDSDMARLNAFASQRGFDAPAFMARLLSGDLTAEGLSPGSILKSIMSGVLHSLSGLMKDLTLPVMACVLLRAMLGRDGADVMLNLMCALCCAVTLTRVWMAAQGRLEALVDGLNGATELLTPVLASVSALSGGAFWSTAAAPLSAMGASLLQHVLKEWGMKLCGAAAATAICCAIAGRYALNRLFDWWKVLIRWMLLASVFAYGGLVSALGLMSAAKDGAAMKAAKSAIESALPIIGGGISDSTGALMTSAALTRSVVGITGVALIIRLCAGPLIRLGSDALALKAISAVTEPLAGGSACELIGHFGDILEMMFAIGACCGAMAALLPGCCAVIAASLS